MDPRIGSIATTFVGSVSPLRDAIVDFLAVFLLKQLPCISLPEQEQLKLLPDLLVSPMLTECWRKCASVVGKRHRHIRQRNSVRIRENLELEE